jgi:hypothetical protein
VSAAAASGGSASQALLQSPQQPQHHPSHAYASGSALGLPPRHSGGPSSSPGLHPLSSGGGISASVTVPLLPPLALSARDHLGSSGSGLTSGTRCSNGFLLCCCDSIIETVH